MVKALFKELKATAAKLGFSDPSWLKEEQTPEFKTFEGTGTGPELLLLHGLFGALSNWEKAIPHFAKYSKPIALHFPLLTAPRHEVKIKSLSVFTEAFVRERNLGPVAICGNSLGGHVALRLCLARPELVDCLILTGTSGLYEHSVDTLPVRPDEKFVREHMRRVFYSEKFVTDEIVAEMVSILQNRMNVLNLIHAARSAKKDNLHDLLPQIKCPTLLLWGEDDHVTTMDIAETFHRQIPNSKLITVKGCGHAPMIEHPEWFSEEVGKFLKEHSKVYKNNEEKLHGKS